METGTIAVIGNKDTTLPFEAIGLDGFQLENITEIKNQIITCAEQGYVIILIEDSILDKIPDIIEKYAAQTTPGIIAIPDSTGDSSNAVKHINSIIKNAIGLDIAR